MPRFLRTFKYFSLPYPGMFLFVFLRLYSSRLLLLLPLTYYLFSLGVIRILPHVEIPLYTRILAFV